MKRLQGFNRKPNLAELQFNYQHSLMSRHELESQLTGAQAQLEQSNAELQHVSQRLTAEKAAHAAAVASLQQLQAAKQLFQAQCAEQSEQIDGLRLQLARTECYSNQLTELLSSLHHSKTAAGRVDATTITATYEFSSCCTLLPWLVVASTRLAAIGCVFVALLAVAACALMPLLLLLGWCISVGLVSWLGIQVCCCRPWHFQFLSLGAAPNQPNFAASCLTHNESANSTTMVKPGKHLSSKSPSDEPLASWGSLLLDAPALAVAAAAAAAADNQATSKNDKAAHGCGSCDHVVCFESDPGEGVGENGIVFVTCAGRQQHL